MRRCALAFIVPLFACTVGGITATGTPDSGTTATDCVNLIPLRLWSTEPSAVALLYRAETCAGEAVQLVPGPGQSVPDLYRLSENDAPLSSEAVPSVSLSGGQRVYVSLLLDFSASTIPVKTELLDAARTFAETLLGATQKAFISLSIFDGRTSPHMVLLPTRDLSAVRATVTALKNAGPGDSILGPTPDTGSTNLHGAFVDGVTALQQRQRQVMQVNAGGVVTSGYTVVFTDGADTAERVDAAQARQAVEAARASNGAADAAPNVQTYAVALAGADFTDGARTALKSIVGADRYFLEGALTDLSARFTQLAQRIADESEATHLLTYCSPARAGQRSVELFAKERPGTGIGFSFSADGFAPGCAEFFQSVCAGKTCAGFNCGACDDATETCEAQTGRCINACVEGNLCSGEMFTTPLGYSMTCGGDGVRMCGGMCVDTASNDVHCGTCNNACDPAEQCINGTCQCPGGGEVCGGTCRSAASFQDDDANCGRCGNACETLGGSGEQCIEGDCICPGGGEVCNGACQTPDFFQDNDAHCGSCGNACTGGAQCAGTECSCTGSGESFCDGACRAASWFSTLEHCGGCGVVCDGICAQGTCVAPTQLAVGQLHQCALMNNGTVRCWGSNGVGQLGTGTITHTRPAPVSGLSTAVEVAAGATHSCARLMDGTVQCWGFRYAVGLGAIADDARTPVTVPGVTGALEIASYGNHTCARLMDGSVKCWGSNSAGELGDGTTDTSYTPVTVSGLSDAVEITVGWLFSCARTAGGQTKCWGQNSQRKLGFEGSGDTRAPGTPVEAAGLTQLAAGQDHVAAISSQGLVCWGASSAGQCPGVASPSTAPAVYSVFGVPAQVVAGATHTCARLATGEVACWGDSSQGQLAPGIGDVVQLAAQGDYTCGIRNGGTVTCWGRGNATPQDVEW